MFVRCCHCTWCQRETGSAFAINALIEAHHVSVTKGAPKQVTLPSASGQGQVFTRCTDCGVTLWSNYAAAKDKVHFLRVGTLDDPTQMPPDIHIFTSSKQPWVVLPDDVPAGGRWIVAGRGIGSTRGTRTWKSTSRSSASEESTTKV